MGIFRKVVGGVKNVVSGVSKKAMLAVSVGVGMLAAPAAKAAGEGVDIVSYDASTGSISWDFSQVLTMLVGSICAALAAAVVIFVIVKGWGFAKRFFRA